MAEPKVRFKRDDGSSYPSWIEYSISDLFTKIGTKNKNCENTNVITNSAEFGLIPQRDYFDKDIAVEGKTDNYTIIQAGDFVYNPRKSSYAPMGPFNCYRLEEDGIVSPLYSCLRPKGILNPEYLLWYFQTDKWYGYVNDHGAQNGARHDRVGMTDKILMGIPVFAPCDEEQQKIADFLSSVDEIIAANEEEVANLEKQKQAVMKKIFSQEMRFKSADGSHFPEWEESPLNDISSRIIVGLATTVTPYYRPTGVPMFRNLNIKAGYLDDRDILYLEEEYASKQGGKHIHAGDILTVHTGNIGWSCVVPEYYEGALSFTTLITTLKAESITNDYVCAYLNSDLGMKQMQDLAFSGGRANLNTSEFQKVVIPIPCLEEQHLISDFLSDFDKAIAATKKELELWKTLKKGLLQQMFI